MAVAEALDVGGGAGGRDWMRAHAALTRLARERAAADAEEGRWLLLAWRSGAHVFLGYGSFSEYVERLLGYSPRATREKLRVAEALEGLPRSALALERGELSWCAARELTRVATADTEPAWIEAARGKTTRELERLVAGKHPGELPPRAGDREPVRRHVLRFEVAPETFATFREAMVSLRREAGGHLDDDALLLAMARQVLGVPGDDGRSSYRISYELCPACGQGAQVAGGEAVRVGAEILEMATCDGERFGVHAAPVANENHAAKVSDPRVSPGAAHVGRSSSDDAASDPFETAETRRASRRPRARQGVAPALRRAVLARDRHCCRVPGCTHTRFVDVHHIRPRSEGGANAIENLITLCTAHHRASHRGELGIEGSASAPSFRHADGTPYGQVLAAESTAAFAKIFSALRHLGFREREVRAVLVDIQDDTSLRGAPIEQLLREALRRIRGTP